MDSLAGDAVEKPRPKTEGTVQREAVAEAYDRVAGMYDSFYQSSSARAEDDYIAGRLADRTSRARMVLDVGCGSGHLLTMLPEIRPAQYRGIDVSERMIDVARWRHPGFTFERVALERMGPIFGGADVVVSLFTLHLADSLDVALARIRDIIRPGGLVFLTLPTQRHLESNCACHVYERGLRRHAADPDDVLAAMRRQFWAPAVEYLPNHEAPEHYLIATGHGRHYRATNDERPWHGPGGPSA